MTAPTLLETILENLEDAVVALDTSGAITTVNSAAERLLGRSRSHLLGKNFAEECEVDADLRQAVERTGRGETVRLFETIYRGRAGAKPLVASATVTPLYPLSHPEVPPEQTATPQGAVVTLRDISRTRELEELVRQVERVETIGTLAAGLAHEIKNPLGGIRGAAQLLKRSVPAGEQEGCDLILREVDRLRRLVEELLDAGHPRTLSLGAINIHQVLQRVIELIPAFQRESVQVVQNYDPSLPPVWGDRDALQQVFLNLIANATEAAAETRRDGVTPAVLVRTQIGGDRVRIGSDAGGSRTMAAIRIHDTGPGIPADVMPRLFTPFFTTKEDGTGLGLVMCHRIVTEHRGAIHVESTPQEGTTFIVTLPLAPAGPQDAP